MFKSNQQGTSQEQQQTLARDRELNAICSKKIDLESTLVEARRSDDHARSPKTVVLVIQTLRDLVKICDELINYQGQDEDKIQNYKTEKKSFEEALTKIPLTRKQNSILAQLRIRKLEKDLELPKSYYTLTRDTDRQQKAIPLARDLKDLAEAWGECGKYQEQDKDKLKGYTQQKEILETALAISRKDADHDKIAKMLRTCDRSDYSLKGFDKKDLDKEGIDPIEDAKTFHKLGNTHYNLKNLHREKEHREKAKEYYQKALDINERFSYIGDIEVAEIFNNLGSIDHASGDYQKAKENFEKSLPIFEELNGSDDIKVAMVSNNIGTVHRDLKNHKEAQKLFKKALPIYKKAHGPEHIEVGIVLNKLGNTYYSLAGLQKENEAKELYEKAKNSHESALPIYEKFYGSDNVIVAELLDNLGYDYLALRNDQEAKKLYERELVIYKMDLEVKERRNPDSIEVAEALRNVGNAYYNLDDFQNAIVPYERELKIRERHYNSYITEVIDPYSNNMFKVTNEALEEKHQKEKVSRKIELAKTLDNLGGIYLASGDHKKAEKSYKDALEHYGSDSPFAVEISEKLKKTTKSLIEATKSLIEQLKETLAEKERNSSTDHFLVGLTLRDLIDAHGVLANAYSESKDYQNQNESLENQKRLLKKALPILKENFGPTNTTVVRLNKLALELGIPSSIIFSTSVQAASSKENLK